MLTDSQQAFLIEAGEASVTCELRSGIPAALTLAQAILESGWGKVKPGWNIFGIKDYQGSSGRQLLLTREWFNDKELAWFLHLGDQRSATAVDPPDTVPRSDGRRQYRVYDWFATFPDLASCFSRRSSLLLQGVYREALVNYIANHDLLAYVIAIAKTYSTSPNYATVLMSIIRQPEVVEELDRATQAVGRDSGIMSPIPT